MAQAVHSATAESTETAARPASTATTAAAERANHEAAESGTSRATCAARAAAAAADSCEASARAPAAEVSAKYREPASLARAARASRAASSAAAVAERRAAAAVGSQFRAASDPRARAAAVISAQLTAAAAARAAVLAVAADTDWSTLALRVFVGARAVTAAGAVARTAAAISTVGSVLAQLGGVALGAVTAWARASALRRTGLNSTGRRPAKERRVSALQLNLVCSKGQEVQCAKALMSQVPAEVRPILVALAAEIVTEHEARVNGCRVVLVAASEAERVLSDLAATPIRA